MAFYRSTILTLLVCGVLYSAEKLPKKTEPEECIILSGLQGTCKSTKDCFTLQSLVKNSSSHVNRVLTNSTCGSDQTKICCAKCGKSLTSETDRIITTTRADSSTWPWIVKLKNTDDYSAVDFVCAGSLISDEWILTAANCDRQKSLRSARFEFSDMSNRAEEESFQEIPIDRVIPYPQYNVTNLSQNNIALVRLKYPVKFSGNILPICLAEDEKFKESQYFSRKRGTIGGWGTFEFDLTEHLLQDANVIFVSREECQNTYDKAAVISDSVICAMPRGTGICASDSGGPLVLRLEGIHYLVGVSSYGIGCETKEYPSVYTNVAHYADWINKEIMSSL